MKKLVLIISILTTGLAPGGSFIAVSTANAGPSARETWLAPVDPTLPTWSREALLHEVLGQTKLATRDQAIALLGPPDLTRAYYDPGSGLTDRIDEYRLSAANTKVFRLDSRADGLLSDPTIDYQGCVCPSCREATQAAGPVLTDTTVSRYLATLKDDPSQPMPLGAIEHAVGRPGFRIPMRVTVGGQDLASIEVAWRLAGDAHRFFIVWGHSPFRNHPKNEDMPITYFTQVTISNLCLAP